MARKKRNKQDTPNTVGRKTKEKKFKMNCLSENVIIIRNNGKSVKVKANNQSKEINYRRKPKKQVEFLDTMLSFITATSTEDTVNNPEKGGQQKEPTYYMLSTREL